ncbi:MAG TPA: hypothetical protein VMU80_04220 [Bryobacteraceae bacterium]|nr:hypothetical protein [Bryobacteraceae bacterium]
MEPSPISGALAAAIDECWPDGVIAEFDASESYFNDVYDALEHELGSIHGASLLWQTAADEDAERDWQSYHTFFVSPRGSEFEFETETEAEEAEEPAGEPPHVTYPGKGYYGCIVVVSLAAPVAAVLFSEFAEFDDGSISPPDPGDVAYSDETGEPADPVASYQQALGEAAFAKLDGLRSRIAAILVKHELQIVEPDELDVLLPEMGVDDGVDVEPPVTVRDAFFFHGA